MTTNTTTTASPPAARSLHEICDHARMANCGQCWVSPGRPCTRRLDGVDGFHVARLGRAMRRGLISGPDLIAVLQALIVFTGATIVYDETPGGPGERPPDPPWPA
jgi:hypothetical protein